MTQYPDNVSDNALFEATPAVAKLIIEMQNDNPHPEGGTLGFIMGTAMALGNIAALYASLHNRQQKKEFLRIVQSMVADSFKEPFVTGRINNPEWIN